jgi:glucans biosynthesis protein
MTNNPMQSAHDAPRCKAKSSGKLCGAPAVRGCRVCRMHRARGGAPTGKRTEIPARHANEATEAVSLVYLLSRLARKS